MSAVDKYDHQDEKGWVAIRGEAEKYLPPSRVTLIFKSYNILATAATEHGLDSSFVGQSLDTALHLMEGLGFQGEYVACALLYYPFLIKSISEDKTIEKCGTEVSSILQSLAKLGAAFEGYLPWISPPVDARDRGRRSRECPKKPFWDQQTSEDKQTTFLAIAKTPETAILKVVDRLYLLKWLKAIPVAPELYQIIAQDSLDIYGSVAGALGVWSVKWQVEDLAFGILQPKICEDITADLNERRYERQARVDRAIAIISKRLASGGLAATVTGRAKHIYGVYRKMGQTGKSVQEINDLLGIRVIVGTESECYQSLGILFDTWHPVEGIYEPGKFYRDWIAKRKQNGYQSIHTTMAFENKLLEVQIRTQTMHDLAEYGVAAHWVYKKAGNSITLQERYKRYVEQVTQLRRSYEQRRGRLAESYT